MSGRLYDRKAWKRLREQHLRAHPLCEECYALGIIRYATDVDHVVALASSGEAFDPGNLRSMCHGCHSRKTMLMDGGAGRARGDRVPVKGCDANGMPLDAGHWWRR